MVYSCEHWEQTHFVLTGMEPSTYPLPIALSLPHAVPETP